MPSFLVGIGRTAVIELYPTFASPDQMREILESYRLTRLSEAFSTYHDAHNEFLNLATSFGMPAMALCFAFWVCSARARGLRTGHAVLLRYFVAGVLMISVWDDILSKRWIWVTLGILFTNAGDGGPASSLDDASCAESPAS